MLKQVQSANRGYLLLRFALLSLVTQNCQAQGPDFTSEIRPILEARCLGCHGPDKQKGGLRFDLKASALAGGDSGPAISPGKPEESLILERVSSLERGERMPPEGDPLTPEQIRQLRDWVQAGAAWPDSGLDTASETHWAFQPLLRPAVPDLAGDLVGHNPVDQFLFETLIRNGLNPSPEANRRTLIRRLSFDLRGLPPTPEEVQDFVADVDPGAYEKLVDRWLASPQFGERWARHWLDVVRFAESNGFETNTTRANAWPYRDWVIASFNSDRPFDQFVQMQLAGDTLGSDEATGFLVGGPMDQVKSPDPVLTSQQRADELHDMVSTTSSAFLGLTLGCARCHNHKFDPISQNDYYAVKAVFEGVNHGERPQRGPNAAEQQARSEVIRKELAQIGENLKNYEPVAQPDQVRVIAADDLTATTRLIDFQGPAPLKPGTARGEASDPGEGQRPPTLSHGYLFAEAEARDLLTWNPGRSGVYRIEVSWGSGWHTHTAEAHYLLDQDGDLATPADQVPLGTVDQQKFADGTGSVPNAALWSGFKDLGVQTFGPASRLVLRAGQKRAFVSADLVRFTLANPNPSASRPNARRPVQATLNIDRFPPVEARFVRFIIEGSSQSQPCLDELEVFSAGPESKNVALASAGAKVTASGSLPGYEIHKLEHVNDGRYGNEWSWISNEADRGTVTIELAAPAVIDRVVWSRDRYQPPRFQDRLANRYRIEISQNGEQWTEVASSADRVPFRAPDDSLNASDAFSETSTSAQRDELADLRSRSLVLTQELAGFSRQNLIYAGRFEAKPGVTRRLHRGDPMQPREEVQPGAIAALGNGNLIGAEAIEPQRRLALGRWITGSAQPLAARVIVNRLWQHHFGTGLVDTPSDFGRNGGRPSHPELLDWLAAELVGNGWNLKPLHRLILSSHAYRQASTRRNDLARIDSADRLLGRFPPRRLEAEAVRDAILQVSGVLDSRMGGPGFDLFEPNTNYVKVYKSRKDFGPPEFRRMVYQAKPRMQLDDTFGAFDCPDAGQIAPKRHRSITPQQALSLLNSPFTLDQATRFSSRLEQQCGPAPQAQIEQAFQLALQRSPDTNERSAAEALVAEHGLATLCRALLNANEFLFLE